MAPRRVTSALTVLAALLAGCGDDGSGVVQRRAAKETPAPRKATPRSAPRAGRDGQMTRADATRLRPVLSRWADALRKADFETAAEFFALPAVVSQGVPLELSSRGDAETFNAGLPCGARLTDVQHDGRYIVGTFALTERPGGRCGDAGNLVRVAFVFSGERFSEWYQVPDAPGASPGPPRRPENPGPAPRRPATPADGTVQA